MSRAVLCAPLALLLIAAAPTIAQTTTAAADAAAAVEAIGAAAATTAEGATLQYFELPRELRIKCGLNNPPAEGYLWKKNDTDVRQLAELKERFRIENNNEEFVLPPRTAEDDAGLYSCSAAGQTRVFEIRGNPVVKLAPNSNVVEGQKLKLACRVIGKPHPALEWLYYNGTKWGALEDARFAAGADGSLTAAAAERGDAGEYMCRAVLPADSAHLQHLVPSNATTTLRVKDMYAALWPFLGICAEVFILCAIILVYEKRRTKPELDDSDTDNHDQKKS